MMKLNVLCLGFVLLITSCINRNKLDSVAIWNDSLSIEMNIANNAIAFQTNNTFPFLDKLAKTRDVIILGEEGHYDLTTSAIKVNMIKYLQQKGFNAVGLEGFAFLTAYVFSNPEYYELTKNWKIEELWSQLWVAQSTCKPLIDMINKREIKIWGIDSYVSAYYDISSLKILLDKYKLNNPIRVDWNELQDLFERRFLFEHPGSKPLTVDEQCKLMNTIDSICNYVRYIISIRGENNDLKAILQWRRNVNTAFADVDIETPPDKIKNEMKTDYVGFLNRIALTNRSRDMQIAENVVWITESFPNEKFTVWCANYHGIKNISQATFPMDSLLYYKSQTMGEGIYNKLGDKLYILGFTSFRRISNNTIDENSSKLEVAINNTITNAPFAYIDFEPLRFADGFRDKRFENAAIMKKSGNWLYMFDGIYYIYEQKSNF